MSIDWKKTASALKRWREKRNITQDKLAAKVGIRWNSIARIEIGDRRPSIDLLEKIAHVLGCRVHNLLKEEAKQMTTIQTQRKPSFLGAPNFIRARVREAQEQSAHADYESVGFTFSKLLNTGDLSADAFDELRAICEPGDARGFTTSLLNFIRQEFPACLGLIPPRRKEHFLQGVIRGMAEGQCDIQPAVAERFTERNKESQRDQ